MISSGRKKQLYLVKCLPGIVEILLGHLYIKPFFPFSFSLHFTLFRIRVFILVRMIDLRRLTHPFLFYSLSNFLNTGNTKAYFWLTLSVIRLLTKNAHKSLDFRVVRKTTLRMAAIERFALSEEATPLQFVIFYFDWKS